MFKESFTISTELPCSATEVYHAWLDTKIHSKITGGGASIAEELHSNYSTWGGYISGQILELEPGARILQTWRTMEFFDHNEDSIVELTFKDLGSSRCLFTLNHKNLPEGTTKKYKEGWQENYFAPMLEYFKRTVNQ